MRILCNLSVFFHGVWGNSLRQSRLPGYPFRLLTAFAATLPLLSLRDIFPRSGEVGPQGDGFSSGGKFCGIAIRLSLWGNCRRRRLRGSFPTPPREKVNRENPQIFPIYKLQIIFPLNMARAQAEAISNRITPHQKQSHCTAQGGHCR